MNIRRLLGRHELPGWFRKSVFIVGGVGVLQIATVLLMERAVLPKIFTVASIYVGVGSILLFLALRWPGMALAAPFILIPNLHYEKTHDTVYLWAVTVPSTLLGIAIIVWTGGLLRKKQKGKEPQEIADEKRHPVESAIMYVGAGAICATGAVWSFQAESLWFIFYGVMTLLTVLSGARCLSYLRKKPAEPGGRPNAA